MKSTILTTTGVAHLQSRDVGIQGLPINPRVAFGLSVLMSMLSSIVLAMLFVRPWIRTINSEQALIWLVAPHMFLRFIGLSFFVPGVVSGALPKAWSWPAGYGDFVAGILAIITTTALAYSARWAIDAAWLFNIWGAGDLFFAFYKGVRVNLEPGALGAGFYIVTAVVPPLLVSHALMFELLVRSG